MISAVKRGANGVVSGGGPEWGARSLEERAAAEASEKARKLGEHILGERDTFNAYFALGLPHHDVMHEAFLQAIGVEEAVMPQPGEAVEVRPFGSARLVATANYFDNGQPADIIYTVQKGAEPLI